MLQFLFFVLSISLLSVIRVVSSSTDSPITADPCLVQDCAECSGNWSCSTCIRDISSWNTATSCLETAACLVENCLICVSGSSISCQECNDGYTLNAGSCSKTPTTSIVQNPDHCATAGQTPCISCSSGYHLTDNYDCSGVTLVPLTTTNCAIQSNTGACLVCAAGHFVYLGNCIPESSCSSPLKYQDSIWCKGKPYSIIPFSI